MDSYHSFTAILIALLVSTFIVYSIVNEDTEGFSRNKQHEFNSDGSAGAIPPTRLDVINTEPETNGSVNDVTRETLKQYRQISGNPENIKDDENHDKNFEGVKSLTRRHTVKHELDRDSIMPRASYYKNSDQEDHENYENEDENGNDTEYNDDNEEASRRRNTLLEEADDEEGNEDENEEDGGDDDETSPRRGGPKISQQCANTGGECKSRCHKSLWYGNRGCGKGQICCLVAYKVLPFDY